MPISLVKSNIVIVASTHNPSIISPHWLKEKDVINESPKEFVNTPEFSLFNSKNYQLIVERQRLQIDSKRFDIKNLNYLSIIAKRYISLLPHIPYQSLGINFVWQIKDLNSKNLPEIGININSINDISNILKDCTLNYGCIIHAKHEKYLLKLTIEPRVETTVTFNFNYHHLIEGLNESEIRELLDNFVNLYHNSNDIITSTISISLKEEKNV